MLYEIFHITQFIFQLIYMAASQLQIFFMTEFDSIIEQAFGRDLQIFGSGVTVLEGMFSLALSLVFIMIIFNFFKSLLPS